MSMACTPADKIKTYCRVPLFTNACIHRPIAIDVLEADGGKKFKAIFTKGVIEDEEDTIRTMSKFCSGACQKFVEANITAAAQYVQTKVRSCACNMHAADCARVTG